jgi:hypothetical protein
MARDLQDLQLLENNNIEKSEEKPLQKPKIKKEAKSEIQEEEPEVKPIVKRERTAKQIEAFNKAREKMIINASERKQSKAEQEELRKKEIEETIVKKAIAIKKKEIKKKAVLEEISDDETPMEEIVKIKKSFPKRDVNVKEIPAIVEKPKTFFEKYKFV